MNHLSIDVSWTDSRKFCAQCNDPFLPGDFRVTKAKGASSFLSWHLDCIKPEYPTKINFLRDVSLKGEAVKYEEKLIDWVTHMNEVDIIDEAQLPQTFFENKVKTSKKQKKRMWLEVFKFLSAETLETAAELVCKEWHAVAREDELWIHLFEKKFYPNPVSTGLIPNDYRDIYIRHHLKACWQCKHIVPNDQVHYICPLFNKPLCTTCSTLKECVPLSLYELKATYGIKDNLLTYLNVPMFKFGKSKCSYFLLLKEKINNYRKQRKTWLLDSLEKEPIPLLSSEEHRQVKEMQTDLSIERPRLLNRSSSTHLLQIQKFIESYRKERRQESRMQLFQAEFSQLKRQLSGH